MARLLAMPAQAIVDGFKGVLDFYLWKGIACVRKWPYHPKRKPYPAEKANQDRFARGARAWDPLPEHVKVQYRRMAAGTAFTPRDLFMRLYLVGPPP